MWRRKGLKGGCGTGQKKKNQDILGTGKFPTKNTIIMYSKSVAIKLITK